MNLMKAEEISKLKREFDEYVDSAILRWAEDSVAKIENQIKAKNSKLQPFVRKVGNVFSVQMGSYQDFNVAKSHAQSLGSQGFDVWIYQQ